MSPLKTTAWEATLLAKVRLFNKFSAKELVSVAS